VSDKILTKNELDISSDNFTLFFDRNLTKFRSFDMYFLLNLRWSTIQRFVVLHYYSDTVFSARTLSVSKASSVIWIAFFLSSEGVWNSTTFRRRRLFASILTRIRPNFNVDFQWTRRKKYFRPNFNVKFRSKFNHQFSCSISGRNANKPTSQSIDFIQPLTPQTSVS